MNALLSTLALIVERARIAADYSRFAALPGRYLDDAGLTRGELDAAIDGVAFENFGTTASLAHSV